MINFRWIWRRIPANGPLEKPNGGEIIMKTFLLAGAAAAALMTSAMADQCPPLKVMASVDMIVEHGRILVPVTVDGENVYFTLGTAAPYSGISAAYAEAHHFPKRHSNVSFIGLNGEVANTMAMAPSSSSAWRMM